MKPSRRGFLAAAASLSTTVSHCATAEAQPRAEPRSGLNREINDIFAESDAAGFSGPRAAGAIGGLDLAELINQALSVSETRPTATTVALRAGLVLSELTRNQRDGVDTDQNLPVAAAPRFPYSAAIAREYSLLLRNVKIRPSKLSEVNRVVAFITSSRPRSIYKGVETDTGVPWYIVGALHYREANSNFVGHLHNGDPLFIQTVHVPARRPEAPWPPDNVKQEQLWRLSAADALKGLMSLVKDWTAESMCYGLESYNGFGCRNFGINSPYLWNYTDHYNGGGFPRDHVFDRNYVSKQIGIIPIVLALQKASPDVQIRFST